MKKIKVFGSVVVTVGIFLTGLLIFPLEFFFISFVAVLYLLRTIEKEINTMNKTQIQDLMHR